MVRAAAHPLAPAPPICYSTAMRSMFANVSLIPTASRGPVRDVVR